ncbi:8-oxo-dGTP diphosphatase [Micrococcales bacterium KH10]|nr:8-oxo-dGTP diphosphatase [Micrococcales bacterium KH10]
MSPATVRVVPEPATFDVTTEATAKVVQAAGCLIWRLHNDELQVLVIHRPHRKDWSWPKGQLDKGELQPVAAIRETAEETGLQVALGLPLPGLQYLMADHRVKRSHYWSATPLGSQAPVTGARYPVHEVDPSEIDEQRWVNVSTARDLLTRKADQVPLDALVQAHEHDRLATRPLIIVRHGKAQDRSRWSGSEKTRPLTPFGSGQAAALMPLLAAYDLERVVTSPWRRCAATVEPFATASGVELERVKALTEKSHDKDPRAAQEVLRGLIESDTGAVLCTHRPVLPNLLEILREYSRPKVARALPRSSPYLQPGTSLVAHIAETSKGPRIVSVEKFRPTVW